MYKIMDLAKVLKKKDIIKVHPEDSLDSVLHLFSSTHDAAFVFDNDAFKGVIHPYHVRIKKSFPPQTKVKHALMHPPRLTHQHSIKDAARMMIESKLHYLPVFADGVFDGIITARGILQHMLDSNSKGAVADLLTGKKQLRTVLESDSLGHALGELKKHKISKLVVTNGQGKLTGVLSLYDLLAYLDNRQEHSKPLKTFQKTQVLTVGMGQMLTDVLRPILKHKIGSVIVVDKDKKPLGILTTKDLLAHFAHAIEVPVASLRSKHVSAPHAPLIEGFVSNFNALLKRTRGATHSHDIQKAEIAVEEKKRGDIFEAAVSLFRTDGKKWVFKHEDRNLLSALQHIKHKAKRFIQERK